MVLMGKQMYGASLKSLSPKCLEELAIEAEELADCWEDASIEDVPPQAKTKLQWLLANYCEIREEMIDIAGQFFDEQIRPSEYFQVSGGLIGVSCRIEGLTRAPLDS